MFKATVIDSSNLPHDTRVKVTLVARLLLRPAVQSCAGANNKQDMFILKYYFTSKPFATVLEAFSNVYPDKEVPNKTTVHQVVTFQDTGSVCL
jgi:hypothetical protein